MEKYKSLFTESDLNSEDYEDYEEWSTWAKREAGVSNTDIARDSVKNKLDELQVKLTSKPDTTAKIDYLWHIVENLLNALEVTSSGRMAAQKIIKNT